jgi:hypothetical protein
VLHAAGYRLNCCGDDHTIVLGKLQDGEPFIRAGDWKAEAIFSVNILSRIKNLYKPE